MTTSTRLLAVLMGGGDRSHIYGPFLDPDEAKEFAGFLTREVDPARVVTLISPADELLGWWRTQRAAEAATVEEPSLEQEEPWPTSPIPLEPIASPRTRDELTSTSPTPAASGTPRPDRPIAAAQQQYPMVPDKSGGVR